MALKPQNRTGFWLNREPHDTIKTEKPHKKSRKTEKPHRKRAKTAKPQTSDTPPPLQSVPLGIPLERTLGNIHELSVSLQSVPQGIPLERLLGNIHMCTFNHHMYL